MTMARTSGRKRRTASACAIRGRTERGTLSSAVGAVKALDGAHSLTRGAGPGDVRLGLGGMKRLEGELEVERRGLLAHPLYAEVNTILRLRRFMALHAFAVWDFMSLAKRLQRDLTCVEVPWLPPKSSGAARFINEVVLAEESDVGLDGRPASHLELYRRAMQEVGADTEPIDAFLAHLRLGETPDMALEIARVPSCVRVFVRRTLECAIAVSTAEVLAAFLFGREDVIPEMFARLLSALRAGGAGEAPHYAYYLKRHIELDGGAHGPMARHALSELIGGDERTMQLCRRAATDAIRERIALWDGVVRLL